MRATRARATRVTHFYLILMSALALAVIAGPLAAKSRVAVVITDVRLGFHSDTADDGSVPYQRCKIGMWTPLAIEVECGPNDLTGIIEVECADDQGMNTILSAPFTLAKNKKRTLHTLIRLGSAGGDFEVRLIANNHVLASKQTTARPLPIGGRLYVTLGSRLPDLQEALEGMNPQATKNHAGQSRSWPRFGAFETKVADLPTDWLGYDGVDLLLLSTHNASFITELLQDADRLKALVHWIRQGGRLVVSVDPDNQALVSDLLRNASWQPPVPVTPPRVAKGEEVKRLFEAERFANVNDAPFPALGGQPIKIAELHSGNNAALELFGDNKGRPVVGRMSYGLGQIVLVAFDLNQGPFRDWSARGNFLKSLLVHFEPVVPTLHDHANQRSAERQSSDLTTEMQRMLDTFDVPIISFGWVALFIFIYILIVGPLDYFILKKFFKRLELTWITFPTVVVVVSVAVYFTAHAIKGRELKINKIDVVDVDLCGDSSVPYAAGTTWFTIMSPRIDHYNIGVETTGPAIIAEAADRKPMSADVVSWLGRPETDGPGAMGLDRSRTWSRRAYRYAADARGLEGVPIPVWTTKSFTARWQAVLPQAPIEVELRSHNRGDIRLSGTLKNNLGAELEDVWLLFGERCYPLKDVSRAGAKDAVRKITVENDSATRNIHGWISRDHERPPTAGLYDPTDTIKSMMFLTKIDVSQKQRDYLQQRLDQSWRLRSHNTSAPEAILFARVRRLTGPANEVNAATALPTRLWLQDLPAAGKPRPVLQGSMTQDTFIRVIVPVQLED